MAPTPAAQMPCTDRVSSGAADSSPWIMLANPGMSVSPPDEPLASSETCDRSASPRARQAWMACAASCALLQRVRPSGSIA